MFYSINTKQILQKKYFHTLKYT